MSRPTKELILHLHKLMEVRFAKVDYMVCKINGLKN